MKKNKNPSHGRMIVVLGSHRNGTSAITRALVALGVELGEELMPPVAGDNDKGYWEDSDINEMHHELLDHLGMTWSDLQWPTDTDLTRESLAPFKMRAVEILRTKVAGKAIFGVKNPRISRLLPFWQGVFKHLEREVSYVIAVRNPLSAQRSIAKGNLRGDIPAEKAHYLWLSHVVPSVNLSSGYRRVVVDYDRMIDDPRRQVQRIASALDLKFMDPDAVEVYANSFLQADLRHTKFELDDFMLAPELPVEVASAYSWLSSVAADEMPIDSADLVRDFAFYKQRLIELRPAFQLVARCEKKNADLARAAETQALVMQEVRDEMTSRVAGDAERDRQLSDLIATLSRRDAEVARMTADSIVRESELIKSHVTAVAAFESSCSEITKNLADRDSAMASLSESLAQRDLTITSLESGLSEMTKSLAESERIQREQHQKITVLEQQKLNDDRSLSDIAILLADREVALVSLSETLTQRDLTIEKIRGHAAQVDERIASLEAAAAERESSFKALEIRFASTELHAASLKAALAEHEGFLKDANAYAALLEARSSSLEALLSERDTALEDTRLRAVESERRAASLVADIAKNEKIRAVEAEDNARLASELAALRVEAATFGAKVGRALTRFRSKWMPMDSIAGRWVTRMDRFLSISARQGIGSAFRMMLRKSASQKVASEPLNRLSFPKSAVSSTVATRADSPDLAAWINWGEPDEAALAEQAAVASEFSYQPLISVIIPVYRVPRDVLDETLACLSSQTYGRWQACLVWADTDDLDGWRWLEKRIAGDSRFKAVLLVENGGISRNSNRALEMADGEFIALLDHDDTLSPWAFFDIVSLLQKQPDLDFIYSDKDSLSADGDIRLNALFKPGWSPEMLHSVNYLTHLNVMRLDLVREIGGWDPETDGAQDWDIFFRITERTSRIARIASIHYHWRILPTSTATGMQAKPYAALGQLKAQQAYFRRKKLSAEVMSTPEGLFHVGWPSTPSVAEVVVMQTGALGEVVTVLDMLRAGAQNSIGRIQVAYQSSALDDRALLTPFIDVWGDKFRIVETAPDWSNVILNVETEGDPILVLLDGRANGLSSDLIDELVGWVQFHPEIAWTSAIALHPNGTVYEAGRVLGHKGESAPLFRDSPLHSYGWFGGPLWYRNARAASPYAFATRLSDARRAIAGMRTQSDGPMDFAAFCLFLSTDGRRGLINPFARVYFDTAPEHDWPNNGHLYRDDPYFNPAFEEVSPLRLSS